MEPKWHDVTQHPTRLKPPDRIAEDPDEAGEVRRGSAPAMFGWLEFGVRMGNIKVPNPHTVEAKHKAKRPPQGQATEHRHAPEWSPQDVLRKHDPNVLKGTGTCKPEGVLTVLKSAAAEDLEGKIWHIEGKPSWKGLVEPLRTRFEGIQPRSGGIITRRKGPYKHKNQVRMAGINCSDVHTPLLPFSITSSHSCSVYPHSFRVHLQGCHHRRHRHHWKDKQRQGRECCTAGPHQMNENVSSTDVDML